MGLLLLALVGCAPHQNLYPRLESLAASGQFQEGAEYIKANAKEYGNANRVIYLLDLGVYYHYAGKYEESNQALDEAEKLMDAMFTKSISAEAGAMLTNDLSLPYEGEDFEKVTVNTFRALNYIMLGRPDEAQVEARKVDSKLVYFNTKYSPNEKNAYTEDAFARMLTGIVFEMGGSRADLNDAYISNRQAAQTYRTAFIQRYGVGAPTALKENLLSTAQFMGPDELSQAKKLFPDVPLQTPAQRKQTATVYFIHFVGRGPVKVEDRIHVRTLEGDQVAVAFPRYVRRPYQITGSRVTTDGLPPLTLDDGEPLGAIAVENLQSRIGRIRAKAIARAILKYNINKKFQEEVKRQNKDNDGAQFLAFLVGNIYANATEKADLRGWQTLPDRILVGRMSLPPGKHRFQVEYLSGQGTISTQDMGEFDLKAGSTRFIPLFTIQ
ncbi:MAG: hypothetical protein OEV94_04655 [Deltaproteobacteria bacterium]|nr:hypothetical protein [Deltaproteobacteria bacterium]